MQKVLFLKLVYVINAKSWHTWPRRQFLSNNPRERNEARERQQEEEEQTFTIVAIARVICLVNFAN